MDMIYVIHISAKAHTTVQKKQEKEIQETLELTNQLSA
jgi:hypothetical protein